MGWKRSGERHIFLLVLRGEREGKKRGKERERIDSDIEMEGRTVASFLPPCPVWELFLLLPNLSFPAASADQNDDDSRVFVRDRPLRV